jgi:hypothetical protein
MYWPIGAPRIYAASSSKTRREPTIESDDDAESRETTEGSGSLLNAPSIKSDGKSEDGLEPPSASSTPPVTPGIKPVEQLDPQRRLSGRPPAPDSSISAASEQADKEPLLALRVSRTGHLFAVITATSLTIWQTKVFYISCDWQRFTNILGIANHHTSCCGEIL